MENFKSGEYGDIFDASEVAMMANEDVVAYYKEMLRQDEMEDAVMTAERKGIEKGREEGREKGREEGREEERDRSIRFMHAVGISIDMIANQYDMTVDQIKQILS